MTEKSVDLCESWCGVEKKYCVKKVVGRGAYGEVVNATCRSSGQQVAIKKIKLALKSSYKMR